MDDLVSSLNLVRVSAVSNIGVIKKLVFFLLSYSMTKTLPLISYFSDRYSTGVICGIALSILLGLFSNFF
jgi:predicted membrane chloride channel (bestrophin family)